MAYRWARMAARGHHTIEVTAIQLLATMYLFVIECLGKNNGQYQNQDKDT